MKYGSPAWMAIASAMIIGTLGHFARATEVPLNKKAINQSAIDAAEAKRLRKQAKRLEAAK